jgi:hypothetical protein
VGAAANEHVVRGVYVADPNDFQVSSLGRFSDHRHLGGVLRVREHGVVQGDERHPGQPADEFRRHPADHQVRLHPLHPPGEVTVA